MKTVELNDLQSLLELLKRNGVTKYKFDSLEVEMTLKQATESLKVEATKQPTEDELLFWSTQEDLEQK